MTHLFKRINDVISANINDLVDRFEDPDRMIKQVIRKMEENIAKAREGVVDSIACEKQLQKELESNQKQSAEWLTKAEMAINNGNEEVARSALSRKKEHDNICKALAPAWESASSTSKKLKAQLNALEAKLEEAKRKRSSLVARQYATEASQQMDKTLSNFEMGINAQTKFQRMEDRVLEMEARTEAIEELRDGRTQLERDFLDMEIHAEVEDESQRLKQKMGEQAKA